MIWIPFLWILKILTTPFFVILLVYLSWFYHNLPEKGLYQTVCCFPQQIVVDWLKRTYHVTGMTKMCKKKKLYWRLVAKGEVQLVLSILHFLCTFLSFFFTTCSVLPLIPHLDYGSFPQFWFQNKILDFNAVHPALFNNKTLSKGQVLFKTFVLFSLKSYFIRGRVGLKWLYYPLRENYGVWEPG